MHDGRLYLTNAMKLVAARAHGISAKASFGLVVLALAGCSALQPAPRPVVYDFGPGSLIAAVTSAAGPTAARTVPQPAPLPPLALAEVEVHAALESTAVLYRLAYSDGQQLRPYAQARWSMPPAQMLAQRLRELLGLRRAIINPAQGMVADPTALTLRVDLDEFSHLFASPQQSSGLVRLRATLTRPVPGGERLLAQRSFVAQQASTSPDAPGAVRALALASDALIREIDEWVQQVEAVP
jgi:cholesterol transport system auxiliary component